MHGQPEVSRIPRAAWVLLHLAQLGVALWLLFGGGHTTLSGWLGTDPTPGALERRVILAAFGAILWIRMTGTALVLLERRFGWGEAVPVVLASGVYQIGFAALGAGAAAPLGALDALGVVLYLAGSAVNTGSELQRRSFKAHPENAGKLYTSGLFAWCRHPNYFGDTLWGIGWALVGRNPWSAVLVGLEVSGFVFSQIPTLDRYLDQRYGDAYRQWASHTARLVPFVY